MLTPEELQEFRALHQQLIHIDREDRHDFMDHEGAETIARLRALQDKSRLHLTCCDDIQQYPVVTLEVLHDESGSPVVWSIDGGSWSFKNWLLYRTNNEDRVPCPKHCPFCSTTLPEIVYDPPPSPLCTITDGGYYCDICQERLQHCICLPPEVGWRPKTLGDTP